MNTQHTLTLPARVFVADIAMGDIQVPVVTEISDAALLTLFRGDWVVLRVENNQDAVTDLIRRRVFGEKCREFLLSQLDQAFRQLGDMERDEFLFLSLQVKETMPEAVELNVFQLLHVQGDWVNLRAQHNDSDNKSDALYQNIVPPLVELCQGLVKPVALPSVEVPAELDFRR